MAKYTSEQAQQLNAEWDALWEKEQKYQETLAILTSQKRDADYASVKRILEELGDYKNAKIYAKDAENLIDLAKFLGTYREIEFTLIEYAANGSVYHQNTITQRNLLSKDACGIYYSFIRHCLLYDAIVPEQGPTKEELAQWDDGLELTVDGDSFSYQVFDAVVTGSVDGNYIYKTKSTDVNGLYVKHDIEKWTLERIV